MCTTSPSSSMSCMFCNRSMNSWSMLCVLEVHCVYSGKEDSPVRERKSSYVEEKKKIMFKICNHV